MTRINTPTILIVDDESYILELLKDQLAYYGYCIITACGGKEALQKADELKQIDILLTDEPLAKRAK